MTPSTGAAPTVDRRRNTPCRNSIYLRFYAIPAAADDCPACRAGLAAIGPVLGPERFPAPTPRRWDDESIAEWAGGGIAVQNSRDP